MGLSSKLSFEIGKQGCEELELQVVIFFVRPDPCPKETLFALEMTNGTVMRSYADRPQAASKRFEMKGWIAKIPKPETVGLVRQNLYVPRQGGVEFPELRMSEGLHGAAIRCIFRPDSPGARFP